MKIFTLTVIAQCLLVPVVVYAQESGKIVRWKSKDHYNLFNPTPRMEMRDMSTDRPDATESPYPVDAGHFQLEMSFFDYGINDDNGVKTSALGIAPINIKIGLLNSVDVQFIFTPYERVETESGGTNTVVDGFSDDTQIRIKINISGLNEENMSMAVMPYVKFPTGSAGLSNNHTEGGLIFPIAVSLPADWGMGLMSELDYLYNAADDEYGFDFVHTGTIGHDLPWGANFGGFLEYIGVASLASKETYTAIFSAGVTIGLSDDFQLDGGTTIGLTGNADDWTMFVGVSIRR